MKPDFTVNILTEESDWILRRAALELAKIPGFTVNQAIGSADIDYYLPYLIYKPAKHANKQVGCFTHKENRKTLDFNLRRKIKKFDDYQELFDANIAISRQTKEQMDHCHAVINLGSEFKKEIKFGVCGKVHASGRKNEHWIRLFILRYGFNFTAWGQGWPCNITDLDRESFYKSIDYLVVTSNIEGGCVPCLEALSLGVPVIAPYVGWCWDYPVIRYERDDFDSLLSVLDRLTNIPTWDDWRNRHLYFFENLLAGKIPQIVR